MKVVKTKKLYSEFTADAMNTKRHKNANGKDTSNESGSSFSGVKSLKAALELTITGYDAGIQQLPLNTDATSGAGINCVMDICGGSIDIGEYMSGAPNCFITFEQKDSYILPRLTMYINLCYNCNTDKDTALIFALSSIKIINQLQADYDIRVIGVISAVETKVIMHDEIILKNYGETLVLNNLAAALHPAYFRRIWFKHLENSGEKIASGYGRARNHFDMTDELKKDADKATYRDALVISPSIPNDGKYTLKDCETERLKQYAER